jgi:hypothetical protein
LVETAAAAGAHRHTLVSSVKKPAKNETQIFVKLTDHTCAYNSLTDFEYKRKFILGNANVCKLAEICEIREITSN